MTMARPRAISATVMLIVNTVKTMPATLPLKRENATRLMLTELSISSMPSRMPMVLRRVTTPNRPMQKSADERTRNGCRPMRLFLGSREVDRAEEGRQHQERQQLEGKHEARQHALADRLGQVVR